MGEIPTVPEFEQRILTLALTLQPLSPPPRPLRVPLAAPRTSSAHAPTSIVGPQVAKLSLTSFSQSSPGLLTFKYAPNLMDLERYAWTFNERNDPGHREWVYRDKLPAFSPITAHMKGNATWVLLRDECVGTDSAAAAETATVDMVAKLEAMDETDRENFNHLDVYVTVQRNSSTYVCKMVSLVCAVTIMNFASFAFNAKNLHGGRVVIMMLTTLSLITFHNRQDTEVPNISTVTVMDSFLYTSYIFDNATKLALPKLMDQYAGVVIPSLYVFVQLVTLRYSRYRMWSSRLRRLRDRKNGVAP